MREEKIGTVSHYYPHRGIAAIVLEGELKIGDRIHIKGLISDFMQRVDTIEIESHQVAKAGKGDDVGIWMMEHSRLHDTVYKIIED